MDDVSDWLVVGMKDSQSVNSDWSWVSGATIDGVRVRSVANVPTLSGVVTEVFRSDWGDDNSFVDQVFARSLDAGAVAAWHAHSLTTDRLSCVSGRALIVLYDGRKSSPTSGAIYQVLIG